MRSVSLHESHRQSLAAGLGLIEEHLDRIEVLLKGLEIEHAPLSILERTAEEERNDIQQKVADLRQTAHRFAERFSIALEEASVRQMLAGEVAGTWLILEGCRPRHLRNNGVEMEPSVSAALEDGVQELLTKVLILRGKLR